MSSLQLLWFVVQPAKLAGEANPTINPELHRIAIWNTFKVAQFEPEDANSPPYRLYPLTRLANGGELALATEP